MTTKQQQKHVRVGVGVLVQDVNDPSRVYCGIRKGSHGAGTLALPGGHLEMYESWEECAQREVLEECDINLDLSHIEYGHVTNDPMPSEAKHYVTIFMMAKQQNIDGGGGGGGDNNQQRRKEPTNMEPHKCEGWKSYSWEELEEMQRIGKLFGPLNRLVQDRPAKVLEFLKPK